MRRILHCQNLLTFCAQTLPLQLYIIIYLVFFFALQNTVFNNYEEHINVSRPLQRIIMIYIYMYSSPARLKTLREKLRQMMTSLEEQMKRKKD